MASQLNLLGLVDQLQNMETSFVSILIESALRLASLTDSNIFLLVDTPSGRRVAGTDHLCYQFANGKLIGTDNDMRTKLNHGVAPIVEFPLQASQKARDNIAPPALVFSQNDIPRDIPNIPGDIPNIPRDIPNIPRDCVKRTSDPSDCPTIVKKLKPNFDVSALIPSCNEHVEMIKTENVHDIDNDSDIEEIFPDEFVLPQSNSEDCLNVFNDGQKNLTDYQFLFDYLQTNEKVSCVAQQLPKVVAVDKQSTEVRLLSSVMYDLGKLLCHHVQILDKAHPQTKAVFSKSFEIIWSYIPLLETINRQSPSLAEIGRPSLSLKAYLRAQFYFSFKNYLKRMKR